MCSDKALTQPSTPQPQVEYVFSDKTGTLTSNEMQLREISIKGVPFGSADFRRAEQSRACLTSALRHYCSRCLAGRARMAADRPALASLPSLLIRPPRSSPSNRPIPPTSPTDPPPPPSPPSPPAATAWRHTPS